MSGFVDVSNFTAAVDIKNGDTNPYGICGIRLFVPVGNKHKTASLKSNHEMRLNTEINLVCGTCTCLQKKLLYLAIPTNHIFWLK